MKDLIKDRPFVILWLSTGASGLGSTFAAFLVSWLAYELTGSTLAMGGVWISFMVPSLVIQILAGPHLDRWDRKKVMIFSEWLRAAGFLALLALIPYGYVTIWHLYMTGVLIGIAQPLFGPASMAYTADIVPKDKLMKGNSILQGTSQIMMLAGPALGGLLIVAFGAELVLVILVASLALSGALLLFNPSSQGQRTEPKESWFKQFKAGLQFYRGYPVLFWVGIMMMMINFSSGAAQPLFLPFVREELGGSAVQYGLFTSSFSFGMIFGSLVTGWMKEPRNRKAVMLGSLFCNGVLFLFLGLSSIYSVALIWSFGMGLFAMVFNVNNTTLYQQRVPSHLMGRVMSVRIFLAQAGVPFGAAAGGALAEVYGIPVLFLGLGLMTTVITVVCWFAPVFAKLNDHAPGAVAEAGGQATAKHM